MTLEEFIEGAKDHEDVMDMLKNLMDLTPVLEIIVQGRIKWECSAGPNTKAEILLTPVQLKKLKSTLQVKREDFLYAPRVSSAFWSERSNIKLFWWTVIDLQPLSVWLLLHV